MFTTLEILGLCILIAACWKLLGPLGLILSAIIAGVWVVVRKKRRGEEPRRNQGIRFLFGANDCFDPDQEPPEEYVQAMKELEKAVENAPVEEEPKN